MPHTDNIFLLEFVVDNIYIPSHTQEESFNVIFRFIGNSIQLCDDEFPRKTSKGGKSCLFGLSSDMKKKLSEEFKIELYVLKKNQPGRKNVLGATKINLTPTFNEIMRTMKIYPKEFPITQMLKSSYPLESMLTSDHVEAGFVKVYIRLSCFGQIIIAQFQRGGVDSFLFKSEDAQSSLFECKKVTEELDNHNYTSCDKQCSESGSTSITDEDDGQAE